MEGEPRHEDRTQGGFWDRLAEDALSEDQPAGEHFGEGAALLGNGGEDGVLDNQSAVEDAES